MHFHKWTKWVSTTKDYINPRTRCITPRAIQERECEKCGIVKSRRLK